MDILVEVKTRLDALALPGAPTVMIRRFYADQPDTAIFLRLTGSEALSNADGIPYRWTGTLEVNVRAESQDDAGALAIVNAIASGLPGFYENWSVDPQTSPAPLFVADQKNRPHLRLRFNVSWPAE